MWRLRRNLVRMLLAMVLFATLSRAEHYGVQDTGPHVQAGECCFGGRYSAERTSAHRPVALYLGKEQLVSSYDSNQDQTAVDDVAWASEPLVLLTCGGGIFL